MSFTLEEYETLGRAISSGTTSVRYQDRTVTYRSLDEMVRTRNLMARELGLVRGPNRVLASFDKGLAK